MGLGTAELTIISPSPFAHLPPPCRSFSMKKAIFLPLIQRAGRGVIGAWEAQ